MRDYNLLKKILAAYQHLALKKSKLFLLFGLTILGALLEMLGLSILYPIVLVLSEDVGMLDKYFSMLPMSFDFLADQKNQIILLFIAMASLYLIKNAALVMSYAYNISFAIYFYRNIVNALYQANVNSSLLAFRKQSTGELANTICVQSGRLIDGVIRPTLVMMTELLILLAIGIFVLMVSPIAIAIVAFSCGLVIFIYYGILRRKAHLWGQQRMHAASQLQDLVANTSIGFSEIKVFSKEHYLTEKVNETARRETKLFWILEMYQVCPRYMLEATFMVSFATYFILALSLGKSLPVLLAELSVIAAASFRILPSINRIAGSYSSFSFNSSPAAKLLDTVLDSAKPKRNDSASDLEQSLFQGHELRLTNLSFSYPKTKSPVLTDIGLTVIKGQKLGVLGQAGCGKSTLIEIIAGLYQPTEGRVEVDGVDVYSNMNAWRQLIGYVPQTSFIIPDTIAANIVFGKDGDTDESAIKNVLKQVGLDDFVDKQPEGIYTLIGECGIRLSGGQKQLLCLARALFRKPKLLLLDEPTASLDSDSEQQVLKAIHEYSDDCSIIMVSHRKDNFRAFDVVYECNNGTLREFDLKGVQLAA